MLGRRKRDGRTERIREIDRQRGRVGGVTIIRKGAESESSPFTKILRGNVVKWIQIEGVTVTHKSTILICNQMDGNTSDKE